MPASVFGAAVGSVCRSLAQDVGREANRDRRPERQRRSCRVDDRRVLQALALVPGAIRAIVLVCVAIPYLLGAAMVYRPKIVPHTDPGAAKLRYEDVRFRTDDGLMIAGWFMPGEDSELRSGQYQTFNSNDRANRGRNASDSNQRTDRTIILVHGFASGKATVLPLARTLVRAGFNVLAIDTRAHGQSDGQITSLGADERLEVLAAVRWLHENYPRQARKIYGFGISSGAAAVLAAAADPSHEGQSIAAVAVYQSYDSPAQLAQQFSRERFIFPLSLFADRIALAVASAGVLKHLAIARCVAERCIRTAANH